MPLLLLLQLYFSPFFVQVQDAENARSKKKMKGMKCQLFVRAAKSGGPLS
jgi:hypothetical protein